MGDPSGHLGAFSQSDCRPKGLFMGMAFLDRSSALIFIPLCGLAIFLAEGSIRKKLKIASVIVIVSSFVLMPWAIRNYAIFHKLVITRSSSGYLFWLGNNPNYTGGAMYDKDTAMVNTLDQGSERKLKSMGELDQDKYLMEKALDFVRHDPPGFLSRWKTRIGYFWWFSPHAGLLYPSRWLSLYKIFYSVVILTALFGVFLLIFRRKRLRNVDLQGAWFLLICCVAWALTQSMFYIEGRHRWVVEPVIILFSAWTLVYGFKLLTGPRKGYE